MAEDVCLLPFRSSPTLCVGEEWQPCKRDLSQARALLAEQQVAADQQRQAQLLSHTNQGDQTRRSISITVSTTPVTSTLNGIDLPADSEPAEQLRLQPTRRIQASTSITDVSESVQRSSNSNNTRADQEQPPRPAGSPPRQRPITALQVPRLPANTLAPTYRGPSEPAVRGAATVLRGRGRGRGGRGRGAALGKMPLTLKGFRDRFADFQDFAAELSSTPREGSTEAILTSSEESSQSLEEHRSKRQKLQQSKLPLDGVRVHFLLDSDDARIPDMAVVTMMQNMHKWGAEIHPELILASESADGYTTHLVAVRTTEKKVSLRRVLKRLGMRDEAKLFQDTSSMVAGLRRPYVVEQEWASEAIRRGTGSEELHLIRPKKSSVVPNMSAQESAPGGRNENTQGSAIEPGQQRSPLAYKPQQVLIGLNTDDALPVAADTDVAAYQSDSSDEAAEAQHQAQQRAEVIGWEDLAEYIEQAECGAGREEATDAPRQAPMAGQFIVRRESKEHEDDTDGEGPALREQEARQQAILRQKRKDEQEIWACQRRSVYGGTKVAHPANQLIVDKLSELAEEYDRIGDYWRLSTCRKVIGIVRNRTYHINNFAKGVEIRGIGSSMARKIDEIVSTGQLARLAHHTPKERSAILFARCYGIGPSEAERLATKGARTLDDLKPGNKFGIELHRAQLLGLQYYDDLRQRMPREEASMIHALIEKRGKELDPLATYDIMGSYRRGQADCGDIDILISRDPYSDEKDHQGLIRMLIEQLFRDNLLKHELSAPSDWDALDAKWMGLCSLPDGKMRRIDFLGVPFEELPAALIYFTGNDIFNRSMRLKARKMGYSLNQRGLYKDLIRDKDTKLKVTEGKRIKVKDEKEIFRLLGVKWREPHERLP